MYLSGYPLARLGRWRPAGHHGLARPASARQGQTRQDGGVAETIDHDDGSLAAAITQGTVVLDGGLATQLAAAGHDISDHLWSARLLLDAPEAIVQAHLAYLLAGASVVTTASYQAT